MKANEFRIGNCVLDNNGNIREINIDILSFIQISTTTRLKIIGFEPIPLTEEWLLKFGFEKTEWDNFNSYRLMICNNNYIIVLYSDGNCEVGDIITCKIEYLHQFQNLYFAITGEELKIKEDETI
jgi:hypothetical protein